MPYLHEHSCRLKDPIDFVYFRRNNEEQDHEGLPIDVIYGIDKRGRTHIQALRYSKDVWSEQDAAEHCHSRGGTFHPALKIRIVQPALRRHNENT